MSGEAGVRHRVPNDAMEGVHDRRKKYGGSKVQVTTGPLDGDEIDQASLL